MSQPRHIVPGATHFVSRRTIGRYHLFAPDPRMNQLFLYALGVAAQRYEMEVHVVNLMSDHEHLGLTDVQGVLPSFLQFFHRIVALGTKVLRRWDGPVWDHGKPSIVELLTPEAVVNEFAYAIANPVAAGLVRRSEEWPGVQTRVDELGSRVWRIERPSFFFDPENDTWPATVELRVTLPTAAALLGGPEVFMAMVRARVDVLEAEARAELAARGQAFLGHDRCLKLSPFARARSAEPVRSLNPTFAVGPGNHEARRAAVAHLRQFRADYRAALADWRAGARDVCFPVGTWHMRIVHAVRVVPLAAAA